MSIRTHQDQNGDRRSFLKKASLTGVGLAGVALFGKELVEPASNVHAASYSDMDLGNFALNLEYLEAEFYCVSTYGATLVELGIISAADQSGPTTGGKMVPGFANASEAYIATALRKDEIAHVQLLRSLLEEAAVKKPAINLDALGYGFDNINDWLKLARQFEDVGKSAYLGAAPYFSQADYIARSSTISATEAQHAAMLRMLCITNGVTSPAVDSVDVPPTSSTPFDVDSSSLSIPRTTSQVLQILYAGGSCSGGFFPQGMNGGITCKG